jgi:hypothetical protein
MPSIPAPSITQSRTELKYKLETASAASFAAKVQKHLQAHRFMGKGANQLPRARHYTTTVYFDTPSYALYRAVVANESSLKIRAREYYDVHPELLELATDPGELVRASPVLWVEIKHKVDGRTKKRRLGIPKRDVLAFLERGSVSDAMRQLQRDADGNKDVIAELLALRAELSEPLRPSCVVNYRRSAWEDPSATLRVTIDQRLACFAPQPALLTDAGSLVRERLGTACLEDPQCVIEVKTRGEPPAWLEAAIAESGAAPSTFSKFALASQAVQDAE